MNYNLICEKTEDATRLVTKVLLELYDKYKDNEDIFHKEGDDKSGFIRKDW